MLSRYFTESGRNFPKGEGLPDLRGGTIMSGHPYRSFFGLFLRTFSSDARMLRTTLSGHPYRSFSELFWAGLW